MVEIEQRNNIIKLSNIDKTYSVPSLFEVWNWVGDESVLPYKVSSHII